MGGTTSFSRTAFLQIRVVQSRIGAALLLLPTAVIGPTLLRNTGVDTTLLFGIGACFALASAVLLAAILADRYGRDEFAAELDLLVRWSLALVFSVLPWLGIDSSRGAGTNVWMVFLLAIHTAVNFEFVSRRARLLGPFILGQISYPIAFAFADNVTMTGLTLLWSCTSIPAYVLRSYNERAALDLVEGHRRSARVDTLTGLANRVALAESVQHAFSTGAHGHLVAFDLDEFKAVNDTYGHGAGDAVLQGVAKRLIAGLPERSTIARLGGDEFAAWIPWNGDLAGDQSARLLAQIEDTLALLGEGIQYGPHSLRTMASAGVAVASPGDDLDDLLNEADMAMYWSKGSTHHVTLFDAQMRRDAMERVAEEQRFREAMDTGGIIFWGQPIIGAASGRASGVELLARWPQPDGSVAHAASFIGLARETGLEVELGRQALVAAKNLLLRWAGDPDLRHLEVNINLSPKHLGQGLLDDVNQVVLDLPDPRRLGLEFGEAELIDETREVFIELAQIRAAGPRILIDDFGVGYSSLTYLRTLPITGVKVDPSFVTDIHLDQKKQALTSAILQLAKALDLTVTAEGVAAAEEYHRLRGLGVHAAQGNLFASSSPLAICETRARSPFVESGTTIRAA